MKRALLVLLPAVLAVGLVACGDDDDNTPSTAGTTTATTTATRRTSETETTTDSSEEPDFTLPGGITVPDLGSIFPGGSIPDISIPDISIPDLGSLPTNVDEILKSIFPNLTDDQVTCLADKLGGKIDTSKILSEIQSCGIDPSDLSPGG
jgi:hypothetical protein